MVDIKPYLIIGLVIGVVLAISPLSASDTSMLDALGITPFSEDTVVNIDGFDFNIPKGYGERESVIEDGEVNTINGIDFITFNHDYMNDDADSISISVFYDEQKSGDINTLSTSSGEVKKTIKDTEGYFLEEDGLCSFTYCQDGKTIMISAKDEATISNIMV